MIIQVTEAEDTGQRKYGDTTFGVEPGRENSLYGQPGPVRLGLVHVEWYNNFACDLCDLYVNGYLLDPSVSAYDSDGYYRYFRDDVWLEMDAYYTFTAGCCDAGPDACYPMSLYLLC